MSEKERKLRELQDAADDALWRPVVSGIAAVMDMIYAAFNVMLWWLLWLPHSLRLRVFARWVRMYWRRVVTRS